MENVSEVYQREVNFSVWNIHRLFIRFFIYMRDQLSMEQLINSWAPIFFNALFTKA